MHKYLILSLLSVFFLSNCDQPTKTAGTTEPSQSQELNPIANPKGKISDAKRTQALTILNHRIKSDDKAYAIVEAGVWEYEFVFDGREMSKIDEKKGMWIDFKENHTYTYGKYNKEMGAGKYHYTFDKNLLLMIDDSSELPPQEWDVKTAGDAMVLIGTALYGNNAFQMKLMRGDAIPTK